MRIKNGRMLTDMRPFYQYSHLHWRAAQVSRQGHGTCNAAMKDNRDAAIIKLGVFLISR
jgi:hypothetical protein